MNARKPETIAPSVGRTTGGACIAVGANAAAIVAPNEAENKRNHAPRRQPRDGAKVCSRSRRREQNLKLVAFIGTGRRWCFGGKRGRVMAMLATSPAGVTQWDTLPWHTRLGGTIHALRAEGLVIETVLEGEYRHARYFLRTAGRLAVGGGA